jgi:hypothetical protein
MGKKRKKGWSSDGDDEESESIFTNNPFLEGMSEWMDSPEGQRCRELDDALADLLEKLGLDIKERLLIWPDKSRLTLKQSVQRIREQHPAFSHNEIEEALIDWIELGFDLPETLSEAQRDELDTLACHWVDTLRAAK